MYWLDTLILTLLGIGALLGLWSGFLWQVARMAALSLGFSATILGNEWATGVLHDHLLAGAEVRVCQAVAYVAVFLIVYLAILQVARMLHRGVRNSELQWLDRLFGALLGAGKFGIVLGALCLVAAHSNHPTPQGWLKESLVAPALVKGMEWGIVWMPERYRLEVAQALRGVGEMFQRKEKK